MINGTAVGYIADAANSVGALCVHFSTDYVFDGLSKNGYTEEAQPAPINAYGYSKLMGEWELLARAQKFYLIRTSWLYGPHGKNFVDTIATKAGEVSELKVVDDQFGKPMYTTDLALAVRGMIESSLPLGVYHITNETTGSGISWYEFAKKILEVQNISTPVAPCQSIEFPRPARRPMYSALINTKISPLRTWEEAVTNYLKTV